ncbi:metal resistance protein YCF1 [Schizopora paradoxa]|uniref:Metal resistance protein YCF1 n=1 Tax=Schizopora paradoxa TaxID=27342 RepID=A0A0H2RPZ4_9AGAM|nr:metal resistance protein YCF1 [Schizopora paradoxa]
MLPLDACFCRNPEGWGPISRFRNFDFTLCFEEGILLSTLLVLFGLAASIRCYALTGLPDLERTKRSLRILDVKVAFIALIICTSFANAILVFVSPSRSGDVGVRETYLLEVLFFTISAILTRLNHKRTRRSSSVILLFWPAYLLSLAVWTRTQISRGVSHSDVHVVLRLVVGALGSIDFCIENVGPEQGTSSPGDITIANIFSIWTFGWMTPLLKKGASQFITEEDLPALPPSEESVYLGHRLEAAMQNHTSLWASLFAAYGGQYGLAALLKILQDCLAFLQPQLLRWLLSYVSIYQAARENGGELPNPLTGFMIAAIMFVAAISQTIILHQYFQKCFMTGMRVRAGLVSVVYKKALRLSNDDQGLSSGEIINLMSVDSTRLQDFCTYGLIALSGPFQVILAFVSLYDLLGWSAFVGVAIMVFSVPLNTVIAGLLKKMQDKQMKNRDQRTKMMSELLNNIKSVKLYAWENAFSRRILHVRNNKELRMLRKIGITTSLNMALWTGIPLLVAFSSFATAAAISDKPLTSDVIFPAISLFMLLQFPLAMFAMVTSNIIEAIVSIKRLTKFLSADELQTDARVVLGPEEVKNGAPILTIKNGEFRWSKKSYEATLDDINLTVQKGELVGVLGRVGAGKTSLLSAIVGDMSRSEGEVIVNGSVAYAPQNPWIMSATVRDNIMFSHEYDETFYNLVIEACALKQDLSLLPQGDLTEVGEKGELSLSGGQKARVSLARAVYARADLVLLDDVLAAVDSHVARHVFDHVIGPFGILSTKARILVTNSVSFLKHFDKLVFIRRGIVLEQGPFDEFATNEQSEIGKLLNGHLNILSSSGTSTPKSNPETLNARDEEDTLASVSSGSSILGDGEKALSMQRKKSFGKPAVVGLPIAKAGVPSGGSKEHSEQGRVKKEVYMQYIQSASTTGFIIFLVATIAQQATQVLGNIVLKSWGEHNRAAGGNHRVLLNASTGRYLFAYGMASLSSVLLGAVGAIVMWVFISLRSARRLHESMLHSVLRAPLSFFETTPTGRIMNLFSRDTYVVDQVLARVIQGMFRTICTCAGIVIVIGASFPLFIIAVLPLTWLYSRVMIYYLATSRELKRLDAVTKSPIFAWFSESLGGLTTIRAFSQQDVFNKQNEARIDRNQICYMPSISINRWLGIRLEFVGAVIILTASLLSLVALVTTGVDAGLVGLVLSYGLNTTSSLNWAVRSASEVEQNIVSVERILHYVGLEPEAPYELPESKPRESWPEKGEVEFSDYSMRYRPELDLVLSNISLKIMPSEKIGICGRTGAGKSSLLLALFRIIEPASGTIFVDGQDITKLGLHDLRSSIAIVPQSPDLFEGTIRENIDPIGEYKDVDIWQALDQAHLRPYIESLPEGLDAPVREGGSSLSAGQRQLMCFARALLRKAKILVLDEATSAVDLETDKAIQGIIRGPQFESVTMLIIAHRLNTIMDSDRILVLEAGKVSDEFDTPATLLSREDSVFRSLASEAGLA